MKAKFSALIDDETGVSPVIGVILMVAITVILAAVIGSFVLGLGGDLQQTPQTQLGVDDASDSSPLTAAGTKNVLNINHNGGESIPEADYEIRVQGPEDGSFQTLWDGSATNSYTYSDGGDSTIQLDGGSAPGELSVASSVTIEADYVTGTADFDGEWRIQIIHTPSDSILTDRTVNVN